MAHTKKAVVKNTALRFFVLFSPLMISSLSSESQISALPNTFSSEINAVEFQAFLSLHIPKKDHKPRTSALILEAQKSALPLSCQ